MIDIEKLKVEIIERLKPLDLDKIILFGSYAQGTPSQESDIDLFLVKNEEEIELKARKEIRDLIYKYKIGFDILSAPANYLEEQQDHFHKIDILQNGKIWYERNSC